MLVAHAGLIISLLLAQIHSPRQFRFRAPESSPGTRPDMYYQNAESFLLIGDALGKAMLKLQEK